MNRLQWRQTMAKQPLDKNDALEYHTKVQGVANAVAEMLSEAIGEQDTELLAMLHKKLRSIREKVIGNRTHPQVIMKELESLHKLTHEHLMPAYQKAMNILHTESGKLAKITSRRTAEEIRAALAERSEKIKTARKTERDIRARTLKSVLTDEEIRNMLNYKPRRSEGGDAP